MLRHDRALATQPALSQQAASGGALWRPMNFGHSSHPRHAVRQYVAPSVPSSANPLSKACTTFNKTAVVRLNAPPAITGLERVKGIEPSSSAWKAVALPLSYTRTALELRRSAERDKPLRYRSLLGDSAGLTVDTQCVVIARSEATKQSRVCQTGCIASP